LGTLDVPIETGGKRGYRRAHAAQLSLAGRYNIAVTAWQLRGTLRSHLLDLDASNQREALLKRQLNLQEQILRALEQQAQAGAISGHELFPVRINMIRSRFDLADLERTRAEARARLSEDIGIPLQALNGIQFSFNPLEIESIADLSSQSFRAAALQNRADILSALAEYNAAQSALQLEIAKQYPDVHLQPGYQFDQGDSKWSLGLVVELPVLNQNRGPIAEAEARRQEAAARFIGLQAKVISDIDRATEVLRATQQTVSTLGAIAETQAGRRDSIAAQVKAGELDQVELLNAESELVVAHLTQLDGKLRFHQAIAALEDALQARFKMPPGVTETSPSEAH
jgi:outer membrane protein TolC